ncbi:MAG: NAD(+)/NADH kinase [Thermoplasmata archaeon]
MKIGILANPKLRNMESITRELLATLDGKADIILEEALGKALGMPGKPLNAMGVDLLITIGGDGTILHALQHSNHPIAGINAGQLGFLTEIPLDGIEECIDRILKGDYATEERMRMKVMRNNERLPDCINEAVLHTSHVSKMHHFDILVDGKPALNVRADGLIIATPTGSTSYAMSVGGPIIDPRVDAFVLAPIAPFNLAIRPLVIPANSTVEVRHIDRKECMMVLDGQEEHSIEPQDVLTLGRSESPARFVRFQEDFYQKAWKKLRM